MSSNFYEFTQNGVPCRISFCQRAGWRLQSEYNGKFSDKGAGQRLSYYLGEAPCDMSVKTELSEDGGAVRLGAPDGSIAVIGGGSITFYAESGEEMAQIYEITVTDGGSAVCGRLLAQEAIWGGGEHFDYVNQRGYSVQINAIDKWAYTKGNSYMPIPVFLSSRGSGLFMNRFERMTADFGCESVSANEWRILVNKAPVDLYVYATGRLSDVLYGYSLISGFAPEPVKWSYGTLVCRYSPEFLTLEGILNMAEKMRENDFPWEAVIAEGFDFNNYEALKEAADAVHAMGKKFMVWAATGRPFGKGPEDFSEKYYVRRADNGSVLLPQAENDNPADAPDNHTASYIDITDKETAKYWFDEYWGRLIKLGVDGVKMDFCEQFPDFIELALSDGETPGMHHLYPTLYNTLLYNKLAAKEGGGVAYARGGGIGAQRYPFVWMGDQKRDFSFLGASLKGVLSSGISGVPFVSYDMAGYQPGTDDEARVFMRGIEYTAFTANIQTHGVVARPYDFDESVRKNYRLYSQLHEKLRPYIEEQGKISSETGLPVIRHLALYAPSDKNVWDIEDEFMLGAALLVAPELNGELSRDIYLPAGEWLNIFSGERFGGGWLRAVEVPLNAVPVYLKTDVSAPTLSACLNSAAELIAQINRL